MAATNNLSLVSGRMAINSEPLEHGTENSVCSSGMCNPRPRGRMRPAVAIYPARVKIYYF